MRKLARIFKSAVYFSGALMTASPVFVANAGNGPAWAAPAGDHYRRSTSYAGSLSRKLNDICNRIGTPRGVNSWLMRANADDECYGPQQAKGAVIWNHGKSVPPIEDSKAPSPPYLQNFKNDGWDTFRLNRLVNWDSLSHGSAELTEVVQDLKQIGYRKIVLAGQSFGGFIALMTADASNDVDDVIVTAPAAFGDRKEFPETWELNASRLYPLLEQVRRARVMTFYFQGDEFDPGHRDVESERILGKRGLPHIVVGYPDGFQEHWSAGSQRFANAFASCMTGFVDDAKPKPGVFCTSAPPRLTVSSSPYRISGNPGYKPPG